MWAYRAAPASEQEALVLLRQTFVDFSFKVFDQFHVNGTPSAWNVCDEFVWSHFNSVKRSV